MIATALNWSANSRYTSWKLDDNITISAGGSSNSGTYHATDGWKIYESDGGKVTFTANNGAEMSSITLTFKSTGSYGCLKYSSTQLSSGTAFSIPSGKESSIYFNANHYSGSNKGQVGISKFSVTYKGNVTTYTDHLTACCTPLDAPANVTVTEQTTNSLSFSWEAVTGATGYEYKLSTATDWTSTTENSATISGLEAGTEYTIQVRATTDNTGDYCEKGTIAEKSEKTVTWLTEVLM